MNVLRMRFLSRRSGRRWFMIACLSGLFMTAVTAVRTEEPPVFAITNAKIIPAAGILIDKGTIVVRRGIIEDVGAAASVPPDARVVDATGLTVYPGLIDAFSDIGLEEAAPARAVATTAAPAPGRGAQQAQQQPQSPVSSEERQGVTPYRQAFEMLNPANSKVAAARAAGITTALIMPRRGFFPGQSTLVNLAGAEPGQMVVKTPLSFYVNWGGRGSAGGYPGSLMGIVAFIKQTLLDAGHYATAWGIYKGNPGTQRPDFSRAHEALQPALKRELPVVMPANTPVEIQRALDLADAFKLNLVLTGCAEGAKMAAVLKERGVPVLLAVKYPERPAAADPDVREELDSLRRRVEAPGNAAALARAGVRFAFGSDDMANPRDFIRNVGRAVEAGLDRNVALRALTIIPAELFGVSDRLGTIEKNKTANLILATGDIFDANTRVKYAFVDGRKFDIPEAETAPAAGLSRPGTGSSAGEPAAIAGRWSLGIDTPQGAMESTLTLRQNGASLSGSITAQMGTAEISEGSINGSDFTFRITIESANGSMVVTFTGTVQGTRMTGTVSTGPTGTMGFTGTKLPGDI